MPCSPALALVCGYTQKLNILFKRPISESFMKSINKATNEYTLLYCKVAERKTYSLL
jgi:hypothetical protein